MTAWRRMQDWLVMVLGLLLALTPLAFARDPGSVGVWVCYVIGGLLLASGLWSASTPEASFGLEWATPLLLALLLAIAPSSLGYVEDRLVAIAGWVAAALVVVTSLGELVLGPDLAPA